MIQSPWRFLCAAAVMSGGAMWTTPVAGQIRDAPNEYPGVADIPVLYTEAMAGTHELPEILRLNNGGAVTTPEQWWQQRRPEVFNLVEDNQYGRAPGRPETLSFEVFDEGTPAYDGTAIRKQVTIYFTDDRDDHYMDLLIYLPADAEGPVPLMLAIGWGPNGNAVDDAGVKPGRQWDRDTKTRVAPDPQRRGFFRLNVPLAVERGYGIATFNYSDVDPDSLDSLAHGVRALYLADGQAEPAPDEWGAIAAWGWGVSRALDYFETDAQVDAKKIAITGASRLGKTVLWAGARDQRIACVVASVSGEGGASLSRRAYGERIAHLVAPTRYPYWFARNLQDWVGRMHEAPWDSHMILALLAPRPLLLHVGDSDRFSDPYGEFIAARAASPVYELLGAQGIPQFEFPPTGQLLPTTLGFFMHEGGHGVPPTVWPTFYDFLDIHLKGMAPPDAE